MKKTAAIILGAGKGTRMNSDLPKVMMPVCNKPMIRHVLDTLEQMSTDKIVVVIAPDGDLVKAEVAPHQTAVQQKQLGTGNAVLSAQEQMKDFDGNVLVIFGDTPLITSKTYQKALQELDKGYAIVVVGFRPQDPARYGRLKTNGVELEKIVEFKDASDEEKQIGFCNSGLMAFSSQYMFEILNKIGNNNAANEYYLTDAIEIARKMGLKCGTIEASFDEVASANTKEELALLEEALIKRGK